MDPEASDPEPRITLSRDQARLVFGEAAEKAIEEHPVALSAGAAATITIQAHAGGFVTQVNPPLHEVDLVSLAQQLATSWPVILISIEVAVRDLMEQLVDAAEHPTSPEALITAWSIVLTLLLVAIIRLSRPKA